MSQEIDRRIVEMQFDNAQFERGIHQSIKSLDEFEQSLKLEDSAKGFENLGSAADKLAGNGLSKVTIATSEIKREFSAMEAVAFTALQNITNKAVNAGEKLVKSLTIDQVTAGYSKYEEKIQSVRTIMSATGRGVEDVTNQLDRLNWFTDETSANFSDMVNNISKFTSNGIDLETSITATEGISTWAGLSGQSNAVASRAYYNLAQALGQGYVQAIDWRSIELANMATAEFKQNVIDTAVEEGRLLQVTEGVYETTSATAKAGVKVTVENFRSTLAEAQWFNNDVLVGTLEKYGDFSNALKEATDSTGLYTTDMLELIKSYKENVLQTDELGNYILDAEGNRIADSEVLKAWKENLDLNGQDADIVAKKVHELSQEMYDLGAKAFEANREARSFGQAVDAVKDAVSTRFTNIFQDIFGNAEEATEFFTDLSDWGFDMFAEPMESVSAWFKSVFRGDAASGFDALEAKMEALGVSTESFEAALKKYGIENDKFTEEALENAGSLQELAQGGGFGWLDNNALRDILKSITGDSEAAVGSLEEVQNVVNDIINGKYGNQPDRKGLLEAAGHDYEFYQNLVNKVWNGGSYDGTITVDDIKEIYELTGAESEAVKELVEGLKNGDIAVDDILEQLKSTEMSGRDMFMQTINNVLGGLMFISDIAKQIWANLFPKDKTKGAKSFLNFLMNATGDITEFLSHTEVIAGTISNLLTPIVNTGKLAVQLVRNIVELFGRIADGLGLRELFVLDEDSEALFGGLAKGANNLYEFLSGIIDLIDEIDVSNIVSGLKDVSKWIKNLFSDIKDFFKIGDMKSAGEWSIEGFIEGIKNGAKAAWDSIVGFFKEAVNRVKDFLGIASPSKLFKRIGEFTFQGFVEGLKKAYHSVEKTFNKLFEFIKDVINDFQKYIVDTAFSGEGNNIEVFFSRAALSIELFAVQIKDSFKDAKSNLSKFAKSIKDFFGDRVKWGKLLYEQNDGNKWDTFWDIMSANRAWKEQNKTLKLDAMNDFWYESLRTEAFDKWLYEGMDKGSIIANTIAQLVYIVETIIDKNFTLSDKIKRVADSFKEFHPIIYDLNEEIKEVFKHLWDNLDLVLQIGKLAVTIRKMTSITNMYDSISFFFTSAKDTTVALKDAINSWSNPLARTGTIVKKLSKSQAFFEIAKGIALIGASVWLIVKSFENVYNLVASSDSIALKKTEGIIFGILSELEVIILTIGIFTELISHGGLANVSGSIALNSIATAIKWLAIIIGELVFLSYFATKLSWGTLAALGVVLAGLTIIGVNLVKSCQGLIGAAKDLSIEQLTKTSGVFIGLMGFLVAFMTLAVGLGILFSIKPNLIFPVILTILGMVGAIALVLAVVKDFMEKTKDLDMVNASWVSVGVSNVLMSLALVIAAIAAAVVAIVLVSNKSEHGVWDAIGVLVAITGAIAAMLFMVYKFITKLRENSQGLNDTDAKNLKNLVLPSMIFVGGLIVLLTAAIAVLMHSINKSGPDAYGEFALVVIGIVVAIGALLFAVQYFITSIIDSSKGIDISKEKILSDRLKSVSKLLLAMGAMIAILAVSLYVVTEAFNSNSPKSGQKNNAWKALIVLVAIIGIVGAVTLVLIKALKKIDEGTDISKFVNNLLKIILGMSLLVSVIAGSLWLIADIDQNQLKTAGIAVGAILAIVVLAITIIIGSIKDTISSTHIVSSGKEEKMETIANQMLKIVLAMAAMIGVISIALYAISKIEGKDLVRSAVVIGALMGGVMLFIWAITKLTKESGIIKDADTGKGTKFNKVIKTVIPIIIGIAALCVAAILLGGMKEESLKRGVLAIAIIGGMVTAILSAVALIFKNKLPNKSKFKNLAIIGIITTLVAGLLVLAYAVYKLSKVWDDKMEDATLLLLALAGIMSALFLAFKGISAIKSNISVSTVLLVAALCGGLWVLADAVVKIGTSYDTGHMWKAIGVIGVLSLLISAIIGIAYLAAWGLNSMGPIGILMTIIANLLLAQFAMIGLVVGGITLSLGYLVSKITEFIALFNSQPGMFDGISNTTEESANKFSDTVARKTSTIVQKIVSFVEAVVLGVRDGIVKAQEQIGVIISAITEIVTMVTEMLNSSNELDSALNELGETLGTKIGNVLYNAITGAIKGVLSSLLTNVGGTLMTPLLKLLGFTDENIDEVVALAQDNISENGFLAAAHSTDGTTWWDDIKNSWLAFKNRNKGNEVPKVDSVANKEASWEGRVIKPNGKNTSAEAKAETKAAAKEETKAQIEAAEEGAQEAIAEYEETSKSEGSKFDMVSKVLGSLGIGGEDGSSGLFDGGKGAGMDMVQGLIDGVGDSGLMTELSTIIGKDGVAALNKLRDTLGTHSPSKETYAIGVDLLDGLKEGLKDSEATRSLDSVITKTANDIASTFSSALKASETIEYTPTITPVLDFSTYDSQIESVNAALFAPKLSINGKSIGEIGNMSGTITVVNDNKDIVAAVNSLKTKMDGVVKEINNMQVILDSGALVGNISTKIDRKLGTQSARDSRNSVKAFAD